MHADRTSRAVLALLGLLLLAAGTAGVLAGTDVLGRDVDRRHLLDNPVAGFIGDNTEWFWPVVALVAAVLAVLALRWLIALLSPAPGTRDIVIGGDRSAGRTILRSGALGDALTTELQTYRGVHAARVRVSGPPTAPALGITVRTTEDADLARLLRRIETGALAHAREALDAPRLPVRLDLTATDRRAGRVS
jgi:MFS family permease